ncbi:MAG: hypothetical protein IKX92_00330, partial [Clostridia bacterium]|nr:hypothetical protein [Clostridia bacterium]
TDGNIKYAISVKGRNFPENESKGMRFDAHNIKLLKDFAKSFDMIPAVAFVFTDSMEGVLKIRVFITALDTLIVKAEDTSIKYVHYAKDGGIHFNMQISKRHNLLEQIKSCGEFDYTELEFNSLNDDFRLNI